MTPPRGSDDTRSAEVAAEVAPEPATDHGRNSVAGALRRRRAAVARRLLPVAPVLVARLDWSTLEAAPEWLALPDAQLTGFALQAGAFRYAPLLRMWIDAGRLAAAGSAVGMPFFQALLAQPEARVPLAPDLMQGPAIGAADQVVPVLRATGIAVLLASLPPGNLRDAAAALWAPVEPAAMPDAIARMLIARIESLAPRQGRMAQ